eukprot:6364415-Alexandrium_andersonii.AAC.1
MCCCTSFAGRHHRVACVGPAVLSPPREVQRAPGGVRGSARPPRALKAPTGRQGTQHESCG